MPSIYQLCPHEDQVFHCDSFCFHQWCLYCVWLPVQKIEKPFFKRKKYLHRGNTFKRHLFSFFFFLKQKTEYLKYFQRSVKGIWGFKCCLFKDKGPLCTGKVSTSPFWKIVSCRNVFIFCPFCFIIPEYVNTVTVNNYINIYFLLPEICYVTTAQISVNYGMSDELVAGNSACVKLRFCFFCFLIFCCKFYETLVAVWIKRKKGAGSVWEEDWSISLFLVSIYYTRNVWKGKVEIKRFCIHP